MTRQSITPALRRLVELFWQNPANDNGGSLHIWFSDRNTERGHAAFCAGWALTHGDHLGYYIARIGALYLTGTQRSKLPGH
jgi:hypothetical protein